MTSSNLAIANMINKLPTFLLMPPFCCAEYRAECHHFIWRNLDLAEIGARPSAETNTSCRFGESSTEYLRLSSVRTVCQRCRFDEEEYKPEWVYVFPNQSLCRATPAAFWPWKFVVDNQMSTLRPKLENDPLPTRHISQCRL